MHDPAGAPPTIQTAIADLHAGRRAEAEATCSALLAADPANEVALQIMGILRAHAGDVAGAIAFLHRAVAVAPENPRNYNNLGVLLVEQGRHAEAIASYDAALDRDPEFAEARRNRQIAVADMARAAFAPNNGAALAGPLAAFEQAVETRAPHTMVLLSLLINRISTGETATPDRSDAIRLATAIGDWLIDPATTPAWDNLAQLSMLTWALYSVFALTPFGTTDHLLLALGAGDTERFAALATADRPRFLKAALLFGLDSRLPIDPEALFAAGPDVGLPFWLCLLGTRFVASDAGAARRERLLELASRLPEQAGSRLTDEITVLGNAWMHCSYASSLDKHQIKRPLNRMLRGLMLDLGLADAPRPIERERPARPTILVAAELMRSTHVQYRYFAPYLRQLGTRFRLVLLTEESEADARVRALFDEVVLFRFGGTAAYLRPVVEEALAHRPDIVFWLSVGMRHWGPSLANLRLAPIQIAGLGHSATTHCDTIDYYLTEAGFVAHPELLSERVILLPDAGLRFAAAPDQMTPIVMTRPRAQPVRIAIASSLLKLNPRFIGVLSSIANRASRPVVYEFFPNAAGLDHAVAAAVLTDRLPGALVHPVMPASRYLAALAECDLSFSPFPFGGMHSVVDALRHGVPVLAMSSPDLHGQTDRMLLRRVGMPDWLVARDEDAYIAAALRLIEDDDARVALSRHAVARNIDRTLFETPGAPAGTDVVDAMWWLMRHHETIQASGRKTFSAADWRAA